MTRTCLPLINFGEELTGIRNENLRSGILVGNMDRLTADWINVDSIYEDPDKDKYMSEFLHSLSFHKEEVNSITIWWAKFQGVYVIFKNHNGLSFSTEDRFGINYLLDMGFQFDVPRETPARVMEEGKLKVEVYSDKIRIFSPYDKKFVKGLKKIGKWDGRSWEFKGENIELALNWANKIFGTNLNLD